MGEVGSAAALALAAVFAFAGGRKLARPHATAASFTGLGVPLPATAARVVPYAELGIAGLTVVAPRGGAVAALTALAVFSAAIGRAIATGSQVPCGCFGSTAEDPVSGVDLVRNLLLAGLAVAALSTSRLEPPSIAGATIVFGAAVVAVLGLSLLRLRARVGVVFPRQLEAGGRR